MFWGPSPKTVTEPQTVELFRDLFAAGGCGNDGLMQPGFWRERGLALERRALPLLLATPPALTRRLGVPPARVVDGQVLDGQIELLQKLIELARRPALETLTPERARLMTGVDYRVLAVRSVRMKRIEDLVVQRGDARIPIRLYVPRRAPRPAPALVWFHGGGWVTGSIDTHDAPLRFFAKTSGCAVVSVGYRLAPEHRFPCAVDDVVAVYRFVTEHAAELGLDARRIGVGGDSAGGNLAAVLCHEARDLGLARPALQVLVYPVTDLRQSSPSYLTFAQGYLLTAAMMAWFVDHYLGDTALALDPRASPLLSENFSGLPPALIHTAGFDPLRDEGRAYADRLQSSGVDLSYRCHTELAHGYWSLARGVRAAYRAIKGLAQTAGSALRGAG